MKYHDCIAKLIDWSWHPELVEDDGIDQPSPIAISHAMHFLADCHCKGYTMPTMAVPGCDGDIVLEYPEGKRFTSRRFTDESVMEVDLFEEMQFRYRMEFTLL